MQRLSSQIPRILGSIGLGSKLDDDIVVLAWHRVSGSFVGLRTKAIGRDGDSLVVAVPDEQWKGHLIELAPHLIARINEFIEPAAPISFIRIEIDPLVGIAVRSAGATDDVHTVADTTPEIEEAADRIENAKLRESFIRMAKSIQRSN